MPVRDGMAAIPKSTCPSSTCERTTSLRTVRTVRRMLGYAWRNWPMHCPTPLLDSVTEQARSSCPVMPASTASTASLAASRQASAS
jgi:hypothetical protein